MKKTVSLCLLLAALIYFAGSLFKTTVPGAEEGVQDISAQEMEKISDGYKEENAGGNSEKNNGQNFPEEGIIENFPIIGQMPELPTGCEITALTMMLQYYGYDVDKSVMASEFLPVVTPEFFCDSDGKMYGPDMEENFVGDPFTSEGYICGTRAIAAAAEEFLADQESSLRPEDRTGAEPEELYRLVSEKVPVLVWVTIGMQERAEIRGWYTEDGEFMEWSTNDHGAVLIGYDRNTVTIADPITGMCEYSRAVFEHIFEVRGRQCVVLEQKE